MAKMQHRMPLSFSYRLTMAFVVAIVATTLGAGVPAYLLVSSRLEAQAWDQLTSGERATHALLQAEADQLTLLSEVIAQRPTLLRLLREQDRNTLEDYLRTIQSSARLDMLSVLDVQGQPVAGSAWTHSQVDTSAKPGPQLIASGPNAPPELIVIQHVFNPDQPDELLGFVRLGLFLNPAYLNILANKTGYQQSLLWRGQRFASSVALDLHATDVDENAGPVIEPPGETGKVKLAGSDYFARYAELPYSNDPALVLEVALPVDSLRQVQSSARLLLSFSTGIVILLACAAATRYAHQVTTPLRELTQAAKKIGQGDLSTPVPIPHSDDEVAMLAAALEESRSNTRRVMDELSRAFDWSETLIQSISEGIITVNATGLITSFNQGAERILGYERAQVLNQPLEEILKLQEDGSIRRLLGPSPGTHQACVATRGGSSTTLSITATRFSTPDREAGEIALVLRDITEQEALQNLRGYFLANISHEFRTPLSALKASVEVMLLELDDLSNEEIRRLLSAIHMSVTGLQTLIDNLLESVSIEAGRFTIHRQPVVNLARIVDEAVEIMHPLLDRREQTVSIQDNCDSLQFPVDPTRITQVLVNLLSNASKYGPISQPIEIWITEHDEKSVRVSVADHGPGLTQAERSALFRRFVRLRGDPGGQFGIGLGLYVVKAIIEGHGGEVGVEERPGGGSEFWFTLPTARRTDHESTRC